MNEQGIFHKIKEHSDIFILLVVMGVFIVETRDIPHGAREFPLFFLLLGSFALLIELALRFSSNRYLKRFRELIDGITGEMRVQLNEETPEQDKLENSNSDSVIKGDFPRLLVLVAAIVGLGILAQIGGLMVAILLFTPIMIALLGSHGIRTTIVASLLISGFIYATFGILMGVPL